MLWLECFPSTFLPSEMFCVIALREDFIWDLDYTKFILPSGLTLLVSSAPKSYSNMETVFGAVINCQALRTLGCFSLWFEHG